MTCDHTLWDDPTGLACTAQGDHTTHTYAASDAPDRHGASEDAAEGRQG